MNITETYIKTTDELNKYKGQLIVCHSSWDAERMKMPYFTWMGELVGIYPCKEDNNLVKNKTLAIKNVVGSLSTCRKCVDSRGQILAINDYTVVRPPTKKEKDKYAAFLKHKKALYRYKKIFGKDKHRHIKKSNIQL